MLLVTNSVGAAPCCLQRVYTQGHEMEAAARNLDTKGQRLAAYMLACVRLPTHACPAACLHLPALIS